MPSACRLTTLPEVALCQLPEVSQDVHYRDNGVFMISGPSISLRKKFTAECTRETIFAQALGRTACALLEALLESTLFRKNTTGAAQSLEQPLGRWPIVSPGLNGSTPQKSNLTNHMAKRVWFIAGVTRGIGTEIAKAALVDSNQVVASDRKPEAATKALGRYL
jgi:hypothetical protein